MRKLFSFFVVAMMFLLAGNIFAQAVDIPLSFSDGITTNNQIRVGLDLTATPGIDPALGESDLPPFPPAGAFEARFDLTPFAGQPLSSYQDYRNPGAFPFTGSVEHRAIWQLGTGATTFTIGYNLPPEATMLIQDIITGTIVNSGQLSGTGSYTITFPITAAKVTMTYTNIGTVAAPVFGLSSSSLNFGTVNVGNSSTLPVTVNNTGTLALEIGNIVSSNGQFTFAPNTFPVNIAAGGSQIFDVTFTPSANGNQSGNLTFTHNAAGSPSTLSVQGVGYTPAPVFGVNPASLNFGSVNIGANSVLPLTVNNTGDAVLTLTNIVSSNGQYTFAPNTFPVNIAAGGNAVFNVTFTPTAAGTQAANLTFTHNAAGSPSNYSLTGVGVSVAPFFELSPATLAFGQVSLGIPSTLPVTVNNTGNGTLTISGVVSSDAHYTFAPNTFPINIAGGSSAVFNVTFTPTAAGVQNGDLTFTHNATGSPSVLTMTGEGRTQGGELKFIQSSKIVYDNHNYQDTVVLSGYTGQPLKALQFDILVGNVNGFLTYTSVSRGAAIPASDFFFDTQLYPGAARPDGSHIDTLRVVILGNGSNAIAPNLPDQEILVFSYHVVSISTPQATTYNSITKVTGATATPVTNANILAGPWETLTIFNGTSLGLLGDVNLDNEVDIADILLMIDYILGRTTFNAQQMLQGDISPWTIGAELPVPDGIINVLDLAVLQNIVLTGSYPSGNPVNKSVGSPLMVNNLNKLTPGMDAKLTFYLYKTGITVGIESAKKIKGVQIELNGVNSLIPSSTQISSVFNTANYYQSSGLLRTLTYDGSSVAIDAGEYTVANLQFGLSNPKDIEISKIIVVDENNSKMSKVEVELKYEDMIPLDYSLSQNFPNPFNPNTQVEFSIPIDGFVTIKVYDLLGQEIASLFAGNTQAGKYTINWDGKDNNGNAVSSGNYLYRMTAGDFVQSKKMTFLK
jgi:hypothetical protein